MLTLGWIIAGFYIARDAFRWLASRDWFRIVR